MEVKQIFKSFLALHNRYIPALTLIAIFSLFSYINMMQAIRSIQNDGSIINRSGIQRMLSQNLVLLSLNYLNSPTSNNKDALDKSISIMKHSHNELLYIDQNNAIKKIYYQEGLLVMVSKLLKKLELFSQKPSNELLLEISKMAQEALPLLSNVVKEYELINLEKVKKLEQRQLQILMATFALIVIMLFFIFYPASSKIQNYQEELEQKVKEEVEKNRTKDAKLAQQARSAQMGEMIDMIAHQWRQPLNSISLINSKIELDAMFGNLDKNAIEKSAKNTASLIEYLNHTIDDFRDFFKPNKAKSDLSCEELIDSVYTLVHMLLEKHNISFHRDIECNKHIYTYQNELKQAILTIISNAIYVLVKNGVKEPYIKIQIKTKDNYFIFNICDNGGGINKEIIDKIFEANFTTKQNDGGSGLGLYISKTIIENQCNGSIDVKNSNEGAVFSIKIPMN